MQGSGYRNQQSEANSSGTGNQNREGQYRERDGGRHRRDRRDREDRDPRPRLKERRGGNKDERERERPVRSKEPTTPPPAPTILKIASKNAPPESVGMPPSPQANNPILTPSAPSPPPLKLLNTAEQPREPQVSMKPKTLETVKFLNENLDFCYDSAHKVLSDQANFTVVGVLGLQGTGKSTILSQLCGYSFKSLSDLNKSPDDENAPPFQPENEEAIMNAKHQTGGIDLCVSPDKLILLDVQPILSSSVLSHMIKNETKFSLSSDVVSFENLHELQSIQLGVFLLSICHVIIVVQESVTDLSLWHYLRTIEMLKFSIPDISTLANWNETQGIENEYYPETVFLFNKLSEKHFTPMHIHGLRGLLDRVCPPNLKSKEQFVPLPSSNENEKKAPEISKNEDKHANFFLLPVNEQFYENSDQINVFNDRYTLLSSQFTKKILSLKRKNFQRNITEREWLRSAAKAWDIVRKSSFLNEYNKTLQKMGLYRT